MGESIVTGACSQDSGKRWPSNILEVSACRHSCPHTRALSLHRYSTSEVQSFFLTSRETTTSTSPFHVFCMRNSSTDVHCLCDHRQECSTLAASSHNSARCSEQPVSATGSGHQLHSNCQARQLAQVEPGVCGSLSLRSCILVCSGENDSR